MSVDRMYRTMAESHSKLRRGLVWCTSCGRSMRVDTAYCLGNGWPKCCGYTMTIDSPQERNKSSGDVEQQ